MDQLVFLGKNCDGGVSTELKGRLQQVEADLNQTWQNEGSPGTFQDWVAIRQSHGAAHPGGLHTTGDALDINYQTNPYIATRSKRNNGGVTYGGEKTSIAGITRARVLATAVYDRAIAFFAGEDRVANVSSRGNVEATDDVYTRFSDASTALAGYLQLAFQARPLPATGIAPALTRAPQANVAAADLSTLLGNIPTTERLDEATARSNISNAIASATPFSNTHPNWTDDVDFWLQQILRDYEVVRIPMVIGSPSLTPATTRSPVNGFLDLRREIVVSLCDVGNLRWGASDFGNNESGDVQHFDDATRLFSETGTADEIRIDLGTVAGIQQALASLPNAAYDPGSVDNDEGSATDTAAQNFASDQQIQFTGITDQAFIDALTAALRQAAIPF
jgi:hypothetical protein